MNLKEVLLRNLKSWFYHFWVYAFVFSVLIFGIFMYARTIEDEHISGAFALAPMILLIIIFFISFTIQALREKQQNTKR